MLWGKSFEKIFEVEKNCFFQDTFFEKKFKNNLENFLKAKNFSKFFFQKKCPEKNTFFENCFPITFYIFLKVFGQKKSVR